MWEASAARVTVVIPNWNGRHHLPECLGALAAQSFRDFSVVLVDNASRDDGLGWVKAHHPEVRVLRRSVNGGFAAAVNDGIRASRAEYVALLNNDTVVHPGWLSALVTALAARPDYDFAASLMVFYDDPGRVNAAGDTYNVARFIGVNRGLGEPVVRYRRQCRVLGACAGAALYRRALFDEVGLFDEDFFLISEDTDFNLRSLIAGKRCLFVPGALVRHKCRASIATVPEPQTARLTARNEAIVAAKDLPLAVLALSPLSWPWRLLRQTVLVKPATWPLVPALLRQAPARLAAECDGIRVGLAKRPEVWRTRRAGTREILRWLLVGVGRS